jgi:hypothetical protein
MIIHPAHIALLGDSIFDNAAYVPGELPVIALLRQALPDDWRASLLAVDGSITSEVQGQLAQLEQDVSALVISCGGNDALQGSHILSERVTTVSEALYLLAQQLNEFRHRHREVLAMAKARCPVVMACAIYNAIPGLGADSRTALALYNEIILEEAATAQVGIIDLRVLCTAVEDFSAISPIEPSLAGGKKIAEAIAANCLGQFARS